MLPLRMMLYCMFSSEDSCAPVQPIKSWGYQLSCYRINSTRQATSCFEFYILTCV